MANLKYSELKQLSLEFLDAFNRNDLDAVMAFFGENAVYEELNGVVTKGHAAISETFSRQFSGAFGQMVVDEDDTFIDADAGKVMSSWDLDLDLDGKRQRLAGLDLLEFKGKLLMRKRTYVKSRSPLYESLDA